MEQNSVTRNDAPIERTITLNPSFVDSLTTEQLQSHFEVIVEASQNHLDADKDVLREEMERGLGRVGMELSPVELERTAEQLVGDGVAALTIRTNDGTVLFESAAPSALNTTP